jgi:hypothetical protein
VAANAGLQMSALTALEKMAPPPSVMTVAGLVRITALDYLLAAAVPLIAAFALVSSGVVSGWIAGPLAVPAAAIGLVWVHRGHGRRDVAGDMLRVAARVGEVTGVPLVLMGHSHHGELERRGDVVYANSGSWLDGSHLLVRRDDDSGRLTDVELRQWRNGGITVLDRMQVPHPDATRQ